MRPPASKVLQEETDRFFQSPNLPIPPLNSSIIYQLTSDLIQKIVTPLEGANAILPQCSKYKIPTELPPYAIAKLFMFIYCVKFISFGDGDSDSDQLAIYIDEGPNKGIYSIDPVEIKKRLRIFNPNLKRNDINEIIDILKGLAKHVRCNQDKDIIPVNNGLFDYKTKTLLPFTPELVYTTKCKVDYVDNPQNPHFHNTADNTDWDVESWMQSLSDDTEIVNLLWQVVGAVIRPGESWNKAVLLYSEAGNNGKGTLCKLMRQLCGDGTHIGLQISDFEKEFRLEGLLRASAIITDENDVNDFIGSASTFKAIVTHDEVMINRKYKSPVPFRFTGLMVQCVNGLPKFKDRSGSLYRRFIMIPFLKCFTGQERRYIKDDYLERPEVLQYVLHKVLHMNYHELSEPAACKALLSEYKEFNDPVREFLKEMLPQFVWDLIPSDFLFDLYVKWHKRNSPSGQVISKSNFVRALNQILPDYPGWTYKQERVGNKMAKPEPLIAEYGLDFWRNQAYSGSDRMKIGLTLQLPKTSRQRGLVRVRTSSTGVISLPNDDDDDNDNGVA